MLKRLKVVLVFLLTQMSQLFAQNLEANLEKYWSYRDRLTTEFMVVGDGQGMSMPAERKDTAAGFLKWSDNTIWLGWYTGMLALEYHMLANPRYDGYNSADSVAINRTLDELYFAIKGIIRLDEIAESSFPSPCDTLGSIRNGFFIRDDVNEEFISNFPGIDFVLSDFIDPSVYFKEMSQDQVYHLLMGLALVKKFLPVHVTIRGMNLRREAIDQALHILDWVHEDGWVIENPACQNKKVDRGPDAFLLSDGVNELVRFFSDGSLDYDADVTSFYELAWSTLVSPDNMVYDNENNLHMAMVIAAMGKGWGDTTLNVLMKLGLSNRWYAYPLLYIALHDDTTSPAYLSFLDTINYWSEQMLDEAPPEGPYSLYPDSVTHGYAVNNRFIRSRPKHYIGTPFSAGGQFNGLDYMMLFNLYYTVSPSKWPQPPNTAVKETSELSFEIFPNPVGDYLHIKTTGTADGECWIQIFDAIGMAVYPGDILMKKHQTIDVSQLPGGIYFLRYGRGDFGITKFVKGIW